MTTNPKCLLKGEFARFQTSSILFSFIWFVKRRRNYLELNPKGRYQSSEKEKENLCVLFTYSLKWAREIRKFHVAIVQRRLRNVQKEWCTWKFVVLLISTYFFAVFVALAVAKALYCFDPKILLPWQRDVTLLLSIRVHLRDGPTGEDRTVCNNRERADHVNEFYFTFSCPLPVSFKLPDFFFKNISLVHQFVSSDNTQNTSLN